MLAANVRLSAPPDKYHIYKSLKHVICGINNRKV